MLLFFPRQHPDEVFYGACGRYHRRSKNISLKETVRDLFGVPTATAVVDFPSRLDYFSSQLPPGTLNDPDKLIRENTLLPLFRPFLPKKRFEKLVAWMKGSSRGGSIHETVGAMGSGIPMLPYLRWCPECVIADTAVFGEAYWHRSHQVAGVTICHLHGRPLHDSDQLQAWEHNKHFFLLAPMASDACNAVSLQESYSLRKMWVAQSVSWLLDTPNLPILGLPELRRRYLHLLKIRDLASYSGRVEQRELRDGFVGYWGDELLKETFSPVDLGNDTWLSALVRKPRRATHPVRHLLLMGFLDVEVADFLFGRRVREKRPFGRGPWPCLNPVADHHRRAVILKCEVTTHTENGRPVGNFRCSCGFGYARTGPDCDSQDRFRVGRVLTFGPLWEGELRRLILDEKMSLRAAARRLGVDTNTVKKHLRVPDESPVAPMEDRERERKQRRNQWLNLCREHRDGGQKQLRALAPADFAWLYRHDREWLSQHPPKRAGKYSGHSRAKWAARDAELAVQVGVTADNLRSRHSKLVRVTATSIGKQVGRLAYLQKRLERLPLTKAALGRVVESEAMYAIRRVQHAASRLLETGEPIEEWRVVRQAGLRPGYPPAVQREISRVVNQARTLTERIAKVMLGDRSASAVLP